MESKPAVAQMMQNLSVGSQAPTLAGSTAGSQQPATPATLTEDPMQILNKSLYNLNMTLRQRQIQTQLYNK